MKEAISESSCRSILILSKCHDTTSILGEKSLTAAMRFLKEGISINSCASNYFENTKKLAMLTDPQFKESNNGPLNKSPIKDLEICEIFGTNADKDALLRKQQPKFTSNRELLTAIKGINQIDN